LVGPHRPEATALDDVEAVAGLPSPEEDLFPLEMDPLEVLEQVGEGGVVENLLSREEGTAEDGAK